MKTKIRSRLWYYASMVIVVLCVAGSDLAWWKCGLIGIALGMSFYAGALDAVKERWPRI